MPETILDPYDARVDDQRRRVYDEPNYHPDDRSDTLRTQQIDAGDVIGQHPTLVLESGAVAVELVDVARVQKFAAESWHTWRYQVGSVNPTLAQLVVNRDAKRMTLTVQNLGPGTIEIGDNAQLQPGFGFPLVLNASIDLDTRAPVYAIIPTGGQVSTVSVITTNEDG